MLNPRILTFSEVEVGQTFFNGETRLTKIVTVDPGMPDETNCIDSEGHPWFFDADDTIMTLEETADVS